MNLISPTSTLNSTSITMSSFEQEKLICAAKLGILQKLYFDQTWDGNDCKKFYDENNLQHLPNYLKEVYFPDDLIEKFIQVLNDIRVIYDNTCGIDLYSDFKSDIRNFKNSWEALVQNEYVMMCMDFRVTWINKVHFIVDHFSELLEKENEGLGNNSDQNIECMHSYVDKQLKKGCYWTTVSTTKACGEKQHAGVLKINAYSVKLS